MSQVNNNDTLPISLDARSMTAEEEAYYAAIDKEEILTEEELYLINLNIGFDQLLKEHGRFKAIYKLWIIVLGDIKKDFSCIKK